jgi:hypothetical protein
MVRAVVGQFRRRIIMGNNEAARLRLWREKRGEVRLSLVRLLFTGPDRLRLPETDAGASSIFVDELDPDALEGAHYDIDVISACRLLNGAMPAFWASSCWLQSRRPRAALHCAGVNTWYLPLAPRRPLAPMQPITRSVQETAR